MKKIALLLTTFLITHAGAMEEQQGVIENGEIVKKIPINPQYSIKAILGDLVYWKYVEKTSKTAGLIFDEKTAKEMDTQCNGIVSPRGGHVNIEGEGSSIFNIINAPQNENVLQNEPCVIDSNQNGFTLSGGNVSKLTQGFGGKDYISFKSSNPETQDFLQQFASLLNQEIEKTKNINVNQPLLEEQTISFENTIDAVKEEKKDVVPTQTNIVKHGLAFQNVGKIRNQDVILDKNITLPENNAVPTWEYIQNTFNDSNSIKTYLNLYTKDANGFVNMYNANEGNYACPSDRESQKENLTRK